MIIHCPPIKFVPVGHSHFPDSIFPPLHSNSVALHSPLTNFLPKGHLHIFFILNPPLHLT